MIQHATFLGIPLRTLAQRRTLVAAYYLLLLVLVSVPIALGKFLPGALIAQTFVLGALFGGFKAGGPVKSYTEAPSPEEFTPITVLNLSGHELPAPTYLLDERERHVRDRAHFLAYRILIWSLLLTLGLLCFVVPLFVPFFTRNAPTLLWFLAIYALSLPQSVILWTEPEPLPDPTLRLLRRPA